MATAKTAKARNPAALVRPLVTPEGVDLRVKLADAGTRASGFLLDVVIIVTAAGERAFSAGGDLRAIYDLRRAGRIDQALAYWRDEYRLNAFIRHYRKPYVSLIDGPVMGGGVGISIHGSHRIAGDRFRFAMPECGNDSHCRWPMRLHPPPPRCR